MKLSIRLTWMVIGIIFALFLSEVFLGLFPVLLPWDVRVVYDYSQTKEWNADAGITVLKPDMETVIHHPEATFTIKTTSLGFESIGFRDDGIGESTDFRILALGDSFTMGSMVEAEDCWTEILEQRLSSQGVDVINAGRAGSSTVEEARLLETYGVELQPDVIVVGFTSGNDFRDISRVANAQKVVKRQGSRRIIETVKDMLAPYPALYQVANIARRPKTIVDESLLVQSVRQGWLNLTGHRVRYKYAVKESKILPFSQDNVELHLWITDDPEQPGISPFVEDWDPYYEKGWQFLEATLMKIKATSQTIGAKLVVFIFPSPVQVYWDDIRDRVPDAQKYNVEKINRSLLDFCKQNDIYVYDLLREFKEKRFSDQLYFPYDGHWSPAGNRLAAQLISDYISENELIPVKEDALNASHQEDLIQAWHSR